jgi:hypothetical protein
MLRPVTAGQVLAVLVGLLLLGYLAVVQFQLSHLRYRVRVLQAVSVGMSREHVMDALGVPHRTDRSDRRVPPGGEMLMYPSTAHDPSDIEVALDANGKVTAVYYPDISGPLRR